MTWVTQIHSELVCSGLAAKDFGKKCFLNRQVTGRSSLSQRVVRCDPITFHQSPIFILTSLQVSREEEPRF